MLLFFVFFRLINGSVTDSRQTRMRLPLRLVVPITLVIIFAFLVTTLIITQACSPKDDDQPDMEFNVGTAYIKPKSQFLGIKRNWELLPAIVSVKIAIDLGSNVIAQKIPCKTRAEDRICLEWGDSAKMDISANKPMSEKEPRCHTIEWVSRSKDFVPMDCISTAHAHWYGGAALLHQRWPVQKGSVKMQPFVANDVGIVNEGYGAVLDRYWVSSAGVGIFVEDSVPLHVSIDRTQLCFKADYDNSPYANPGKVKPTLNYTICVNDDVKSIHKYMSNRLWKRPTAIPHERLFKEPIWSTWARYKTKINQENVVQMAEEIQSHGFPACQIEIDDKYMNVYGEYDFDTIKFPYPEMMISTIQSMGVGMTSWVVPFANVETEAFQYGMRKGYWLKVDNGVPGLVSWWRGVGGILDFTNEEAVQWFFKGGDRRLSDLKQRGVDSFKFDGGETNYLPQYAKPAKPFPYGNPSYYSTHYAEAALKYTNNMLEVRVGYKTQHLPVFVRMYDKWSNWDYDNGLKTVIPTALIFSLLGYPFILPDMIGGNGYENNTLPEKELFLRWFGLNIFLPSMQLSISPWQYDDDTLEKCNVMMRIREEYVSPKLLKLAYGVVETGEPIIRPMWWVDPTNPKTFELDSQFMLGDNILVAPIVHSGHIGRSIYLPTGTWKDMLRGNIFPGDIVLDNYFAELDEIPHFERIHL